MVHPQGRICCTWRHLVAGRIWRDQWWWNISCYATDDNERVWGRNTNRRSFLPMETVYISITAIIVNQWVNLWSLLLLPVCTSVIAVVYINDTLVRIQVVYYFTIPGVYYFTIIRDRTLEVKVHNIYHDTEHTNYLYLYIYIKPITKHCINMTNVYRRMYVYR